MHKQFPASVFSEVVDGEKTKKDPAGRVDSCSWGQWSAKADSEALEVLSVKTVPVSMLPHAATQAHICLLSLLIIIVSRLWANRSSDMTLMWDVVMLQNMAVPINSWTCFRCSLCSPDNELSNEALCCSLPCTVSVHFTPHKVDLLHLCSLR